MEVIEVIEERLFANDDNDELELQYLGFQLSTSLKTNLHLLHKFFKKYINFLKKMFL